MNNDDLSERLAGAQIMNLTINESATATKYAVEDGTTKSDHVFENLTEVNISVLIVDDIAKAFEEMRDIYKTRALVTIQTRTAVYKNLLLTAIPQTQKKGTLESSEVELSFIEWKEVKPEYGELSPQKVSKKPQASKVKKGTTPTTETPPEKKKSVLHSLIY